MSERIKEQDEMTVSKEVWKKIAKFPCRYHGLLWDMVATYMMDGVGRGGIYLDGDTARAYGLSGCSEQWIATPFRSWMDSEFTGPMGETYNYFRYEIVPLLPAQEVEEIPDEPVRGRNILDGYSGTGEAESE